MKTSERHHLKQNEFATRAAQMVTTAKENRDRIILGSLIGLIAILAIIGFSYWRRTAREAGAAALGAAMSAAQAPIVPAPSLPGATQATGTYPTLEARNEASLKLFQSVAAEYPSSDAGRAASYHAAATLLSMGRAAEAESAFGAAQAAAGSTIYAAMSKLGQAEAQVAQGKYDDAIRMLTDLSGDRDGALPVDGVLMQLGRASLKASKTSEAKAAFKRVVDEFPQSPYAPEARQQLTILG